MLMAVLKLHIFFLSVKNLIFIFGILFIHRTTQLQKIIGALHSGFPAEGSMELCIVQTGVQARQWQVCPLPTSQIKVLSVTCFYIVHVSVWEGTGTARPQLASTVLQMNELKLRPLKFCQKKGVFNSDHSSYYCKLEHILPYSSL